MENSSATAARIRDLEKQVSRLGAELKESKEALKEWTMKSIAENEPGGVTARIRMERHTFLKLLQEYRIGHKECRDLTDHPDVIDATPSQAKDWRCDLCREADKFTQPLSPTNVDDSHEAQKGEDANG